jgi:hypothetical protein
MLQKYGIIQDGVMILSEDYLEGYKPVAFAEIPDTFDQETQAVFQAAPVDAGDHIEVGVEMRDLPPDTGGGELEGM